MPMTEHRDLSFRGSLLGAVMPSPRLPMLQPLRGNSFEPKWLHDITVLMPFCQDTNTDNDSQQCLCRNGSRHAYQPVEGTALS